MTVISERQFTPTRMLLCTGDEPHGADVPRIRSDGGVTSSDVRCELCGAPMMLIDAIVVDRHPTLATLEHLGGRAPLYTTAKLHPVQLLTALARSTEQEG